MEDKKIIQISLKENIVKNAIIVIVMLLFYPCLSESLKTVDVDKISDFLLILSILLVIVSFANFAFTYEVELIYQFGFRMLSHFATFLFMLLIGFLLEVMVIAIRDVYPSLFKMTLTFSCMLYLGLSLHDFWDLLKAFKNLQRNRRMKYTNE